MSIEKEERVRGKRSKKKKEKRQHYEDGGIEGFSSAGGIGERGNGEEREREFKACVEREARRTWGVEVEKGDVRDMKRGEE